MTDSMENCASLSGREEWRETFIQIGIKNQYLLLIVIEVQQDLRRVISLVGFEGRRWLLNGNWSLMWLLQPAQCV